MPKCKDCADTHCGCYGMDCEAVCGGKRFIDRDTNSVVLGGVECKKPMGIDLGGNYDSR